MMGPIGFILDLHAAWHKRMGECITAVIDMGSSIKINPGGSLPLILLGPDDPSQPAVGQPRSTLQPNNRADPDYNDQHSHQAGPVHPRRGGPSPENQSYYGPQQPTTEASRQPQGCDGCGRNGHRAPDCKFKGHKNWNRQWVHLPLSKSPTGIAVDKEAGGTRHNCLSPHAEWDEISGAWIESDALQGWRRNIQEWRNAAAAKANAHSEPQSLGGSTHSRGPTNATSSANLRPPARGKLLHLGVIRGGPELYHSVRGTITPVATPSFSVSIDCLIDTGCLFSNFCKEAINRQAARRPHPNRH
jgi:hypothetical protein